jgi:hypothetical protein
MWGRVRDKAMLGNACRAQDLFLKQHGESQHQNECRDPQAYLPKPIEFESWHSEEDTQNPARSPEDSSGVQYADHGAAPEDEGLSLRDDPSLRHFHFVHTAKREKDLH